MKTNFSQEGAATPSKKDRFDKKKVNVRVNPFINFQIGLIAALLLAFVVIELTTEEVEREQHYVINVPDDPSDWEHPTFIEVPNNPPKAKVKPPKDTPPEVVDNSTPEPDPDPTPDPEPEPPMEPSDSEPVDAKPVVSTPVSKVPARSVSKPPITTTMDGLDSMPLFPGCESLDDDSERRACFNEKMKRFVQRKFDTGLANELNLESGTTVKIVVVFTINSKGYPENVKVKAPHPELEKEAYRMIGKLPKITPGKVGGEPVNVFFQLPINFRVNQ